MSAFSKQSRSALSGFLLRLVSTWLNRAKHCINYQTFCMTSSVNSIACSKPCIR